jgi:chromate reductase
MLAMTDGKSCAIIVGSLRKNSNSRAVADTLAAFLTESGMMVSCPEIADLPLFSEDLESAPPEQWTRFKNEIKSADCLIFITPEYNRGYTAVLKNALDIASRPNGQSVWNGKPGGLISVSPGKIGGALSYQQLKQVLGFLNIRLMNQPECYIQADSTFNNGVITDGGTKDFIKFFADKYIAFVNECV